MSQEEFDKVYDEGMENNNISLTDSKSITTNDMLDAAIYRLYFQEGHKSIKEIKQMLNERIKVFENDLKEYF